MRLAICALLLTAACSTGLDDAAGGGGAGEACEGPLGKPMPLADINAMSACCQADGGQAHCLANSQIPSEIQPFVAACDAQSSCIPDGFLATGAAEPPDTCTAFGGAGVCLSICIPQVSENQGLLRPDTCTGVDELCVPCISPIDNLPTGACDLLELATCTGEGGGSNTNPPAGCDDPATCNYEASCPAVIEASTLPACGPDAHCLDASLVPADQAAQLGTCTDGVSLCVPDLFIETGGKFTPASCSSVAGAEGRCLSRVLPAVQAQDALLPQATCGANEKCAPCYDPLTGTATGACSQSCDIGPTAAPVTFAACCSGRAKCVPASAIPDDQEDQLDDGNCQAEELCVPNEILADGPFPACAADSFILGDYTGVCLSDCLDFGIQGLALARGNCGSGFKCAPCVQNGQPTGAPGCPL